MIKKIISILLIAVMLLTSCGRLQENIEEEIIDIMVTEEKQSTLEESTLASAIILGHDDTVKEIIENGNGIDINHFSKSMKWESKKYDSPLSLAMACGKYEIMYYLIEKGAEVEKKQDMAIYLPKFEYSNQEKYLTMLIEHGMDFNFRDENGNNVIDKVLMGTEQYDEKDWKLTQILLENGAEITSNTLEKMLEAGNYGSMNLPKVVDYLMGKGEKINVDDIYIKAIMSDSESVKKGISKVKKKSKVKELGYLVAAFCDKETLEYILDVNEDIEWAEYRMLNAASRAGNYQNIQYLVEDRGFSENVEAQRNCLVVEYAESNKHYEITDYLIKSGFDIPSTSDSNVRGKDNLLAINVVTSDMERLEYNLLYTERVTDCIMVPLRTALALDNIEMFKRLFDFAMENNKKLVYPSIINQYTDDIEIVQYAVDNMDLTKEELDDVLNSAVSYGSPDIVKILLEAGADPNTGDIALDAAYRDNLEILKLLVEYGLDINYKTEQGSGVMLYSAQFSNVCLNYLLDQGIDISSGSGNEHALIVAVNTGRIQNMKDLIAAGIDTSVTNDEGNTAYDMAVIIGNEEILQTLESAGIKE